jgi:CheY-like chemotaxis protein
MRQVLARLEDEGFVVREQGRGTFVRHQETPAVLIAEDDASMRLLLEEYVKRAGYRPVSDLEPSQLLTYLAQDPAIALVFSDVRMPDKETGLAFIRSVRRRWPELPLVALTGYPADLAGLHGTPECPVLILTKPFWPHQIEETLRLALRPSSTMDRS